MTVPEFHLNNIKEKVKEKNFRASDFLTAEQVEEVHEANVKGKKRGFDEVDSYIAEIISRFGYDTYIAWKCGDISEENMVRYIEAERCRDVKNRLPIESVIVASVAGANNPTKGGHMPKSLKAAIKMIKNEEKLAKGGK